MVRYDNVRTSDSREPHETLRGETPEIHLGVKKRGKPSRCVLRRPKKERKINLEYAASP
jgi:hypothetical protein